MDLSVQPSDARLSSHCMWNKGQCGSRFEKRRDAFMTATSDSACSFRYLIQSKKWMFLPVTPIVSSVVDRFLGIMYLILRLPSVIWNYLQSRKENGHFEAIWFCKKWPLLIFFLVHTHTHLHTTHPTHIYTLRQYFFGNAFYKYLKPWI